MEKILFFIAAAAGILLTLIGLSFFISCVWEKERRASIFSGIQALLMLGTVVWLFYLNRTGFFKTDL